MKYTAYLLLIGAAQAAVDPYPCKPEEPCKENLECVMRQILEVKDTPKYQTALKQDNTLADKITSHWCIPEEWVKPVMERSEKWDKNNDTKALFKLIPKPDPKDNTKAYAAGIKCDPKNGRCPYEDLRCVGRRIIKADGDSK